MQENNPKKKKGMLHYFMHVESGFQMLIVENRWTFFSVSLFFELLFIVCSKFVMPFQSDVTGIFLVTFSITCSSSAGVDI